MLPGKAYKFLNFTFCLVCHIDENLTYLLHFSTYKNVTTRFNLQITGTVKIITTEIFVTFCFAVKFHTMFSKIIGLQVSDSNIKS